jgi:anti-sigma regulatory factor (Ser/Thr protein kinase)
VTVSAYEQQLEAEPTSVRAARHAVTVQLRSALDQDQLDRLVLCTSEIVTNAIEHGAPPIELRIARNSSTVRVEVVDTSPLMPRRSDPPPSSIRGRGLLIVERCADGWGVEELADGKAVWFELAV